MINIIIKSIAVTFLWMLFIINIKIVEARQLTLDIGVGVSFDKYGAGSQYKCVDKCTGHYYLKPFHAKMFGYLRGDFRDVPVDIPFIIVLGRYCWIGVIS